MAKDKLSNRALTTRLRELMASVHTSDINDDGEVVMTTKAERLAELLADRALGWEEQVTVPNKKVPGGIEEKTVVHKPEKWAMVMVYERLEGKTPVAMPDETKGLTVSDKVSELAVTRINDLTEQETQDGIS